MQVKSKTILIDNTHHSLTYNITIFSFYDHIARRRFPPFTTRYILTIIFTPSARTSRQPPSMTLDAVAMPFIFPRRVDAVQLRIFSRCYALVHDAFSIMRAESAAFRYQYFA